MLRTSSSKRQQRNNRSNTSNKSTQSKTAHITTVSTKSLTTVKSKKSKQQSFSKALNKSHSITTTLSSHTQKSNIHTTRKTKSAPNGGKGESNELQSFIDTMVSTVTTELGRLSEQFPDSANDIATIQKQFLLRAYDPRKLNVNYFIQPIFSRLTTVDEVKRFAALSDYESNQTMQRWFLTGLQKFNPSVDIEHIQTFVDGATVAEIAPIVTSLPFPTTTVEFDFLLADALTRQFRLLDAGVLNERGLRAAYKMRAAIVKANTCDFYQNMFIEMIKNPNLEHLAKIMHRYIVSYAIPMNSRAHRGYHKDLDLYPIDTPKPEEAAPVSPESTTNNPDDTKNTTTTTTTNDDAKADEKKEANQDQEQKQGDQDDGKGTTTPPKKDGDQDDGKGTTTPPKPKKFPLSPYPIRINVDDLETKLIIPDGFKLVDEKSGTAMASDEQNAHSTQPLETHVFELMTLLRSKKPTTDANELTQQLNHIFEHYDNIIKARTKITIAKGDPLKRVIATLGGSEPDEPNQATWPKSVINSLDHNGDGDNGVENDKNEQDNQESNGQKKIKKYKSNEFVPKLIPKLTDLIKNQYSTEIKTNNNNTGDGDNTKNNDPNDETTTLTPEQYSNKVKMINKTLSQNGQVTSNPDIIFPVYYQDQHLTGNEMLLSDLSLPLSYLPFTKPSRMISSTRVWGHRPNQQDHHLIAPSLLNGDLALFGVFDGAGDEYVSQWLTGTLVDRMSSLPEFNDLSKLDQNQKKNRILVNSIMNTMILKLYSTLDREIVQWANEIYSSKKEQQGQVINGESHFLTSSSTCVIAMHHRPSGSLTVSHLGDSLALLAVDPKPYNNTNGDQDVETASDTEQQQDQLDNSVADDEQTMSSEGDVKTKNTKPVYQRFEPFIVTREHKPDQQDELPRIRANKGKVNFVGPERTPYLGGLSGATLNMSRAFGGFSLKRFGLSAIPNIVNINVPQECDIIPATIDNGNNTDNISNQNTDTNTNENNNNNNSNNATTNNTNPTNPDEITPPSTSSSISASPLSTDQLLAKYNTTDHQALYQSFTSLDKVATLNHSPPIRHSPDNVFNVKGLILGSDGLYETIPIQEMIEIPFARLHYTKSLINSNNDLNNNNDNQNDNSQQSSKLLHSQLHQDDTLHEGLADDEELVIDGNNQIYNRNPFTKLNHPTHPTLPQIGFDARWNGSPSDALVSRVLSCYTPQRYPSDNITGIVTFF